ncbi:MAG: hypothetical protein AAGC74_06940 [Verrucomicrobiota bacterium]
MNPSPSERPKTPARWLAFMCPGCRGLFRAPSNRKGKVACPLCDGVCLLEHPEPSPPPPETTPETSSPKGERRKRTIRKKRALKNRQESKWGKSNPEQNDSPASVANLFWGAVCVLILSGLTFTGYIFIKSKLQGSGIVSLGNINQSPGQTNPDPQFQFTGEGPLANNDPLLQVELNRKRIENAQQVTREFLNAPSFEHFAKLIRDPQKLMPLIRQYYQNHPYTPPGVHEIMSGGETQVAQKFIAFDVVLKNYKTKPIALELTENGYLVDWESWVGYCEIPWPQFISQKTTTPTTVRVRATEDSYYNFSFSDDSQWLCYRLERGIDDPILYGYANANSGLATTMRANIDGIATCILKIKFPPDSLSSSQVLITEYINDGWVIGLNPPTPTQP